MHTLVLPFKQDEIYLGLAQISGLLRIENDVLEIEYKVKDTTLGLLDSSVKTCHIPLEIIDSVEVEKKWFSGKFEIFFNRMPDLDNPFQLEENCLKLTVKKKDLEKAQSFRSKLMYEILERKLENMSEGEEKSHTRQQKESEKKELGYTPKTRQKPQTSENDGGLKNMLRSE